MSIFYAFRRRLFSTYGNALLNMEVIINDQKRSQTSTNDQFIAKALIVFTQYFR